ncbi:MAG: guanine deaminase [Litoreibacter sp.]|nr:guanine deaminase [Litoreibacter sp.]
MPRVLLGQTLSFDADPFAEGIKAARHESHGAVVLENGHISWVGPAEARPVSPDDTVVDYGRNLICAGFIDAHLHHPQTAMIASWGKRLIDWLNDYTFPEEARLADPDYAREIAKTYFDLALSHGTTTMCSFATVHRTSVDSFFEEAQARGLRAITGKTCMDFEVPDTLCDTAQSAYDDSKVLLEKWHGVDRLEYAITPRFSPTSSREQLHALGALWKEHPECLMQTHLSEQLEEITWVKSLFRDARDYLDTYEMHGLLGERLAGIGASVVHCPTSNTFIGSGLFDMAGLKDSGLSVGLATDTGGGSSFSMLRTMAAAYEVAQLRGRALHPAELIWLATCGSARALHLQDKVGNLVPGMEADLVVLDLASTPAIAQRNAQAESFWEALFPTIMMGDDRAIADVWVNGRRYNQKIKTKTLRCACAPRGVGGAAPPPVWAAPGVLGTKGEGLFG